MEIQIKFNVRNFNSGPKIRVAIDQDTVFQKQLSIQRRELVKLELNKSLPCKLLIEHYGKDMSRDTLLDSNGNILDDKALIIERIQIDDVELIDELFLFDFVKDDGTVIKNTNYLGYNGKFVLDIDRDNLHSWYHDLQNSLVSEQEEFSYINFRKEIFTDDD